MGDIRLFQENILHDIQICFTTTEFTAVWQQLENGIMAGCTISPLVLIMKMEVIIRAFKYVVEGEMLQSGKRLPHIQVPACTKRLLDKLNTNLKWAKMKVKFKEYLNFRVCFQVRGFI